MAEAGDNRSKRVEGSATLSAIDRAVEANRHYAAAFTKAHLGAAPFGKLAVVCCMDSRIDLVEALGLELGEAHMIRNAGGRVADAIRSLVVSQLFLGTEEVAIIHHTGCGQLLYTDDSIRAKLRAERNAVADGIAFLPFTDLEQSVRDDLVTYHASPLVRHDAEVRGFVYDVDTGALTEVV